MRLELLEPRLLLATYHPTSFNDSVNGNTLRAAIIAANANPGDDTIILSTGEYKLTIANDLTIDNGIENKCLRGDLDVTDTLTIVGTGMNKTIINAQQLDRVFQNFAKLTLVDLTVTNGLTSNPYEAGGGGILSSAETVLQDCLLTANAANDTFNDGRQGGGIYTSALLTITDSIISLNSAENGYGAGGGIRSVYSSTSQTNTISGSMIADNSGNGGGINISGLWEISRSEFDGNTSTGQGGAILGNADITQCTFSDNLAVLGGAVSGGGMISDSTFDGNRAVGIAGTAGGGGALYGAVNVLDSTFTANTAPDGGAIFGHGTLDGCTISGNMATQFGGGLYADGFLTLKNTIVAADAATSSGPDVYGAFITQGHNLIGDGTGSSGFVDGVMGDMVGTTATPINPGLNVLGDYGGPTQTMALLSTSVAVDAGDNTGAPATDQRGVTRILDGGSGFAIIDIGAFEYDPSPNPIPIVSVPTVKEIADPAAVTLLSTERLVMAWSVTSGLEITSQTLVIDGTSFTPVESTTTPGDYSSEISYWTAGVHTFVIETTNSHGATTITTGVFTVVNPPPPAVTNVVVAEADVPGSATLFSNERLVITWKATCTLPITSQTVTVDGGPNTFPVNGPFNTSEFSCQIGKWAAGTHSFIITSTDSLGDSTVVPGTFTVVAPVPPPVISNIVVTQSQTPRSSTLLPNQNLVMTWQATCTLPIVSQTLTIDGQNRSPINGPFSGLYYSCQIGTWAVGSHAYTITSTDSLGDSSTATGTFTITAIAAPVISSVVVAEATPPKNGILESNDKLVITWSATSTITIVSQTLTVDGRDMWPIKGPYSGRFYSCQIGLWAVGPHAYTIASTDSLNSTCTASGTFTVVAPIPPTIGSVVVAEAGTTTNGHLDPGEPLKITWAASSSNGIAAQSVKIDGRAITPIKGPFSSLYYYCAIGSYAAGTHSYKITTTDLKGVSATNSGTFVVSATLTVKASVAPPAAAASLTASQLGAIVTEATARWEAALGSQAEATLAGVNVVIANLPGKMLGESLGKTIRIDRNAAGYGWFVDTTPSDDAEFVAAGVSLTARKNSAAAQRADLLTAVMHEMGHLLGYGDTSADSLMKSALPLGVRRTPSRLA